MCCVCNLLGIGSKNDGRDGGSIRTSLLYVFSASFAVFVVAECVQSAASGNTYGVVTCALLCTLLAVSAVYLWNTSHRTPFALAVSVTCLLLGCALLDVHFMALGLGRLWVVYCFAAKVLMCTEVGVLGARVISVAVLVVAVVLQVEDLFRFGLLDVAERTSCSSLPCDTFPDHVHTAVLPIVVICLELVFAMSCKADLQAAGVQDAAVREVSAELLRLLSFFRLEEADALLGAINPAAAVRTQEGNTAAETNTAAEPVETAEMDIPPELYALLVHVVHTIGICKQYLPEVVLEQLEDEDRDGQCDLLENFSASLSARPAVLRAPVWKNTEGSIVFTDIKGSTVLWEKTPDVMKFCLQMHDSIIREVIDWLQGFEVKTIGDSFMVAFEQVQTAVNFGFLVHEQLLTAKWPIELFSSPNCGQDATGTWGGIQVRIGIDHGPLSQVTNSVTGRSDFYGHTVNKAARLEGTCVPGSVAVCREVYDSNAFRTKAEALTSESSLETSVSTQIIGDAMNLEHSLVIPPMPEVAELGTSTVVVTSAKHAKTCTNTLMDHVVMKLGLTSLPGMDPAEVYLLLPASLRRREEHIRMLITQRRNVRMSSSRTSDLQTSRNPLSASSTPVEQWRSMRSFAGKKLSVSPCTSPRSSTMSRGSTMEMLKSPVNPNRRVSATQTPATVQRLVHRLNDTTTTPCATVGRMEVFAPEDEDPMAVLSTAMSTCTTCLERTSGRLGVVLGNSLMVGWNTTKPDATHVENAFRFVCLAKRASYLWAFKSGEEVFPVFGLCSGPVHCGAVGAHQQRFHTVSGECVNVSWMLAATAKDEGMQAVYSSLCDDVTKWTCGKKMCLRPFMDEYVVRGHGIVPAYELSMESVARSRLMQKVAEEDEACNWNEEPPFKTVDSLASSEHSSLSGRGQSGSSLQGFLKAKTRSALRLEKLT